MKINDKVECEYHGVRLTGTIDAYDFSGVYVKLDKPVKIYGTEREGVYLNRNEVKSLRLIEDRPAVDCEYFQGYVWPKKEL